MMKRFAFAFFLLLSITLSAPFWQESALKGVLSLLKQQTGIDIKVDKLTLCLPDLVHGEGILLESQGKKIAEIKEANLTLSLPDLLQGKLVFSFCHIDTLLVFSEPESGKPLFLPIPPSVHELQVSNLSFAGVEPVFDITGFLVAEGERVKGDLSVKPKDLSALSSLLSFEMTGEIFCFLQIDGTFAHPSVNLHWKSNKVLLHDTPVTSLHTVLSCDLSSPLAFQGACEFVMSGVPLVANMQLCQKDDGRWHIQNLNLALPQTTLEGNLTWQPLSPYVEGFLKCSAEDLSFLSPLFHQQMEGSLHIKSNFQKGEKQQDMQLECSLKNLKMGLQEVKLASVAMFLEDLYGSISGTIHLSAEEAKSGENSLSRVAFESELDAKQATWPFHLVAEGGDKNYFQMRAGGTFGPLEDTFSFVLTELVAEHGGQNFSLTKPCTSSLSFKEFNLGPLSLLAKSKTQVGTLFATLRYEFLSSPSFVETQIRVEGMPFDILDPFFPALLLSGSATASLHAAGSPGSLSGNVSLELKNLIFNDSLLPQTAPLEARFKGKIENWEVHLFGEVTGVGLEQVSIRSALLSPFEENKLRTSLHLKGDLGPLVQVFTSETILVDGKADLFLEVAGEMDSPEVSGTFTLEQGYLEHTTTGALFQNGRAIGELEGQTLHIHSLIAQDENGGTLSATGKVILAKRENFPFSFAIDLDYAKILSTESMLGHGSGHLTFAGDLNEGTLKGAINVHSASFHIPDDPPAQLQSVDVTYINLPEGKLPPLVREDPSLYWPLHFDIQFTVPKDLFLLQEDLLRSEWRGSVALKGSSFYPEYHGSLKLIEGEYDYSGKIFTSEEATLTFNGEFESKTSLYVVASHQIENTKVDAILKGTVKQPNLSFRSNPPLAQREIVSLLLFNRADADVTTATPGDDIVNLIGQNRGKKGPDPLTKIRKTIGIDRIDINTGDASTSDVSIRIGKYIGKRILLSLQTNIQTENNQIALEANISKNVKVQGEMGLEAEGKLSLKYEIEY